ncbi:MAG: ribosomal protein S18-alanine N-acetyltransferase [Oscillospiraceae bacterium]|nr:ribosomal protein S18-alanine N-acetyltransferase [Oscillospiraceae bacterium]
MTQRDELAVSLLSAENVAGAAALCRECFTTPWPESVYRRELENPQSVGFVCTDGETVVGFIHCDFVLDELTLNTLAVRADYRRCGIAKRLFAAAAEMVSGVCTVCYLEVRESNLAARRLYESLGFRQNGFRPRYYHDPEEAAVLMEKPLGSGIPADSSAD